MPYLRQTSPVFDPASCSRRTAIIRSSVNLDCLIFRLPQGDGLYLFLEELQGLRSEARNDMYVDPSNTYNRINFNKIEQSWFVKFMRVLAPGVTVSNVENIFQ